MSVYLPKTSRYWQYDFQLKGRRFHGSTGVETKRAAEQVERNIRRQAALGELDDAARMTLDTAAARWWDERGSSLKGGDRLESRMARMIQLVGPNTAIGEITTKAISRAIEKRRGQTRTHAKGDDAREYLPSNATVNRDMIDTLRPILNRARKAWGAVLPVIDWQALRMSEPKPKPKELVGDDFDRVLAEIRPHWHDMARFAARYGCRLAELFFALDDLDVADLDNARLKLRERKGGDDHTIPLLREDAAMLATRLGRARSAGLKTVWFRERRQSGPGGKTILTALTYNGAEIAMRRAMERSGLKATKGLRGFHDFRHHAAMTMLRSSGNIRVAQRLLGHADIKSTLVYAHAIETDVRAALSDLHVKPPKVASSPRKRAHEAG